jgi:hypothetical protein
MQRQLIGAFALLALAGGFHQQGEERRELEAAKVTPVVAEPVVQPTFNPTVLPCLPPEPKPEPKPEPPKTEPKPQPPKPVVMVPKLYRDPMTGTEVTSSAIIMVSMNGCGACVRWWNQYAGELRSKGWDVREVKGNFPGVRLYPTFRINLKGKWFTHVGPLTHGSLKEYINIALPDPKTIIGTSGIKRPSSWVMEGNPWTRQALIDHLADHPNHGFDRRKLESMTLEQLNALHTEDHVK